MNPLENTLKELDVLFKETDKEILENKIEELESILENTPEENAIDIQSIKSRLVKLKSKVGMVLTQPKLG